MSFNLTVFILIVFASVSLLTYMALCLTDKEVLNPFKVDILTRVSVVSIFSIGVVALVISLFNLYIKYLV